jgi:hypothetical protein
VPFEGRQYLWAKCCIERAHTTPICIEWEWERERTIQIRKLKWSYRVTRAEIAVNVLPTASSFSPLFLTHSIEIQCSSQSYCGSSNNISLLFYVFYIWMKISNLKLRQRAFKLLVSATLNVVKIEKNISIFLLHMFRQHSKLKFREKINLLESSQK